MLSACSTTSVPLRCADFRTHTSPARYRRGMPRLWFWTQAAIVVFVLAGIVIAITRLA